MPDTYSVIMISGNKGAMDVYRASPYQFDTTAGVGQHIYVCDSIASVSPNRAADSQTVVPVNLPPPQPDVGDESC